jgi:hexosaminidase
VVPEIDMPGHVNAALASYGDLNDDGQPTELRGVVPFGQSALSIEAPATSRFIDDVFSEVAAMTPGEFIHIGGDEALSLDQDEYSALTRLAADAVIANGKTPIGWEETVTAGAPQSLIVQYWLDPARAVQAADAGNRLIVSPAKRAYLDMKYDDSTPVGQAWAGLVAVDTAYDWDPTDEGFADDQVLGVEAPLWTETIRTPSEVDHMVYPRMLGYAEIGWTPQVGRNWPDYRGRLAQHGVRLTDLGVEFYASPMIDWGQS